MNYLLIKTVHMTCIGLSVGLFATRGAWLIASGRGLWKWLRIVPHIVDTVLLASGLTLAFWIRQYPFVNSGWLTAKVIGLIAYIALGVVLFRAPLGRPARWGIWAAALLVFAYIVSVAVTKRPAGFLAGL
ncbi:MAG TPA: SirB2 family protein [Gammaproteobacteria bacterium]|nr:SirB2 family protein [Gammaproteobacteria bacterium]